MQDWTIFFRTFFGLGFLDVHVEMTVDPAQNVTSQVTLGSGAQLDFPVQPAIRMNVMLCLQTNPAGTASLFLTNETTRQRTNFSIATGFPPAVTINAGISRGVVRIPSTRLRTSARSTSTSSRPLQRAARACWSTAQPPRWSTTGSHSRDRSG